MDASTQQNNVGRFGAKGVNRTSQIVTTIIPAGATFPVFQAGQRFYLTVATGEVFIKPNNGSESNYVQGTGLEVDDLNIFANVQIRNKNSFPVVLQIFVGFGNFIDNRLIVFDPNNIQACVATAPTTGTLNEIPIPDLSGTTILDANGNTLLALNRVAIYISNQDIANSYDLLNDAKTKSILTIFPLTSIVYNATGNFRMKIPAGNLNAIVSEVYNAIRPT